MKVLKGQFLKNLTRKFCKTKKWRAEPKIKTKRISYEAIPDYMESKFKDPFDYQLRTKDEVNEDIERLNKKGLCLELKTH